MDPGDFTRTGGAAVSTLAVILNSFEFLILN
jgi:hypothetical protein